MVSAGEDNDGRNPPSASHEHAKRVPPRRGEGAARDTNNQQAHGAKQGWRGSAAGRGNTYGALDLGTNNCRLLIAHPTRRGFRVIDAFSRIIRLGEGVSTTGYLSEPAMERTIDALKVCAGKLARAGTRRARLVATQACRIAINGREFLDRVDCELGLNIEILTPETEARLAVAGCASLIDESADHVLVFDIGGGSSEIIWLDLTRAPQSFLDGKDDAASIEKCMVAWSSLPVGVVTLAEKYGGRNVTEEVFENMVLHVRELVRDFDVLHKIGPRIATGAVHMLGTSGTVTTVAGIQLGLERYDRNRVDGCWLAAQDVRSVTENLLSQSYEQRVAQPCIGRDRADLVLAGCAILEGFLRTWPCERLRVADRGLREGILATLMREDGVYRTGRPGWNGPYRGGQPS